MGNKDGGLAIYAEEMKGPMMKTKILFIVISGVALLTMAAPHTWTFKSGGTFEGDYFSSGTNAVVVRKSGTNYIFKMADLSTNDLAYVEKSKADQKQARLDADVKQMRQAGWIELSSDLIENFPEKVRDLIPGDGTIIHKYGWMDATFVSFNTLKGSPNVLGFGVKDSHGNSFDYCLVPKKLYKKNVVSSLEIAAGYVDEGTPNPLTNVAFNLKRGDKIRLVGNCDDSLPYSQSQHGERDFHAWFYIERIEMIETTAEKKAREQAVENP
jgi:hypothetical protein